MKRVTPPKSREELESLLASGDIEVLLSEDIDDRTSHLLIIDHRRTFEEGEIYEIIV